MMSSDGAGLLRTANKPYLIAGGVLLAVSIFVGFFSIRMRFYTPFGPGPGFFPFILSIILGFLSVAMVVQSLFRPETLPRLTFGGTSTAGYLRVLLLIAVLAGTGPALQFFGYQLTMVVFFFVLLKGLGGKSWFFSALMSVAFSVGTYHLFASFLRVPLPRGVFGI